MLPPGARLLGFDLGEKTIGVALSDTSRAIATPMETLPRGKFSADVVKLEKIIVEHKIGGIVIGLPLNMDGTTALRRSRLGPLRATSPRALSCRLSSGTNACRPSP